MKKQFLALASCVAALAAAENVKSRVTIAPAVTACPVQWTDLCHSLLASNEFVFRL